MDQKQFDDVDITSTGGSHEWRYVPFDAPVLHISVHGQQNLRMKDEMMILRNKHGGLSPQQSTSDTITVLSLYCRKVHFSVQALHTANM